MKTANRKKRHKFMTADTHACVLGLVLTTIALLALCRYFGISDITGVIVFPAIFIYPILRCLWDWIFVIYAIVSTTAKYILERLVNYVGVSKRHIRNDNSNLA